MPTGLRERKKQRTRELIVDTALKLFAKRGYDATTVAGIAEAADISPRTFFGYFPSKEDVVFHDYDALSAELARRLAERAKGEEALATLRTWLLERAAGDDLESRQEKARRRLIRETPSLAARERSNIAELEDVLAAAIAADLGVGEDSLRPHLVSAAALAALSAIARRRDATAAAGGSATEAVDEALAFARGGLTALRRRPPGV